MALGGDCVIVMTVFDDSKVARGYRGGHIQIINNSIGALYNALAGYSVSIKRLKYAAGESRLISCSQGDDDSEGEVRLWNSATG